MVQLIHLPVNRCRSRSGVAYRICGTLHEFKVLLKRMSASSLNNFGSFLMDWGSVMELLSDIDGRIRSLNWTLSRHWLMSEIHAAFSWSVGASRCTATCYYAIRIMLLPTIRPSNYLSRLRRSFHFDYDLKVAVVQIATSCGRLAYSRRLARDGAHRRLC